VRAGVLEESFQKGQGEHPKGKLVRHSSNPQARSRSRWRSGMSFGSGCRYAVAASMLGSVVEARIEHTVA
jgi:hypothetical protein